MEDVATVVLGLDGPDVIEEVLQFLDRSGHARVVATAQDSAQLTEAIRQLEPDVVIAASAIADAADLLAGRVLFALDLAESTRGLRAAIRAGARGYFVWPSDREQLTGALVRFGRPDPSRDARGTVHAVIGLRGGVGTTTLAIGLAAAKARRGEPVVLADLDLAMGDVATALTSPVTRSIADLMPLMGEVTDRQMEEILAVGPEGLRVLHAPPSGAESFDPRGLAPVVDLLRTRGDVVLHVPRGTPADLLPVLRTAVGAVLSIGADRSSVEAVRGFVDLGLIDGPSVAAVGAAAGGDLGTRHLRRQVDIPLVEVPRDPALGARSEGGRPRVPRGRTTRVLDRIWEILEGGGPR